MKTRVGGKDPIDIKEQVIPVVGDALTRMLAREDHFRPFVILEDVATESFVQWCPTPSSADGLRGPRCGSSGRPLRFEAPKVRCVEDPVKDALGVHLRKALVVLEYAGATFEEGLVVVEEDTEPGAGKPDGQPRAFGWQLSQLGGAEGS